MDAMYNYSLATFNVGSTTDAITTKPISWSELEKVMRDKKIGELIIFAIDHELTQKSVAKKTLVETLILNTDGVRYLSDYCLFNRKVSDNPFTCLVLVDPEIKYAIVKAMEFYPNHSLIQCIITDKGTFHVGECDLQTFDNRFNQQVN